MYITRHKLIDLNLYLIKKKPLPIEQNLYLQI